MARTLLMTLTVLLSGAGCRSKPVVPGWQGALAATLDTVLGQTGAVACSEKGLSRFWPVAAPRRRVVFDSLVQARRATLGPGRRCVGGQADSTVLEHQWMKGDRQDRVALLTTGDMALSADLYRRPCREL